MLLLLYSICLFGIYFHIFKIKSMEYFFNQIFAMDTSLLKISIMVDPFWVFTLWKTAVADILKNMQMDLEEHL